MQWFRMYAEFANDPKVQMMNEANQRRLVMLFCMCCGNEKETFQDEDAVFFLRISETEWAETKAVFIAKNFIAPASETQMKREKTFQNMFQMLNWNKRQFQSDVSTERVRKHREKKKRQGNVSATSPEQSTEQNRAEEAYASIPQTPMPKPEPKTRKPKAEETFTPPDWIPPEAWAGFLEHRRIGKSPFTVRAQQLTVTELDKLRRSGNDPEAVLNQSVMRGWQGVFKLAQDFAQQNTKGNENGKPARHANPALNAHADQSDAFLEAGRMLEVRRRLDDGTAMGAPEIGDG